MALSFKEQDGLFASVDCSDWVSFQSNVDSFLRSATDDGKIAGNFIFRGQSCSSWGLQSSFDRANQLLSPADADALYKRRMTAFRHNYGTYGDLAASNSNAPSLDVNSASEEDMEALAQHFGMSTRLLDWSSSLYVAVFFALSKIEDCDSGLISIWSLNKKSINLFSENHVQYIENFYKGNVRNLWQYGSFIRNKTGMRDLSELFLGSSNLYTKGGGGPGLIRFDIPKDQASRIADELEMMRINSMTIFPGMEGVIKWIERGGGS